MPAGHLELDFRHAVLGTSNLILTIIGVFIASICVWCCVRSGDDKPTRRLTRHAALKPDAWQSPYSPTFPQFTQERLVGDLQASLEPPQAAQAPPDPPPVSFVLSTASEFKISLQKLDTPGSGEIEIMGTSGKPKLCAFVTMEGSTRRIQISSPGSEESRCMATLETGGSWGGQQQMKVFGRDDEAYGTLSVAGDGSGRLTFEGPPVNGQEVLRFGAEPPRDRMELRATSVDGRKLAEATRKGKEWRLHVEKNADGVLICTCMLAIILLAQPASGSRPGSSESPGRRDAC